MHQNNSKIIKNETNTKKNLNPKLKMIQKKLPQLVCMQFTQNNEQSYIRHVHTLIRFDILKNVHLSGCVLTAKILKNLFNFILPKILKTTNLQFL